MKSIKELKQLVAETSDLSVPLNYFFDLMEDQDIFDKNTQKKVSPERKTILMVLAAVRHTLERKFDKPMEVHDPAFFEVPAYHFFHGACRVTGIFLPMTVLYFADIKMGVMALSAEGMTDMFRFTLAEMHDSLLVH